MYHLVSILIAAYNASKWIAYSVESAISQDWPRKEIIIVDDGSVDDTLKIARQFECRNIKVLTQENRGASAARNRALSFAQWLDADDLLAPDKISWQIKEGNINPESRILVSSAWSKFYYRKEKARFIPNSLWQDLTPAEWLLKKFNDNVWMANNVWLVSRKLTELAGPWNERLSLDDDGEYFSRVIVASEKIKFIKQAKSYCRQVNTRSISRATSERACKSLYLSLSLNINRLKSLEDSQRTRSACLKLLQRWLIYFYPEHRLMVEKVNALAKELGGELFPPSMSWKYSIIKLFFGWKVAKRIQEIAPMLKMIIQRNWDELVYKFSLLSKKNQFRRTGVGK
jgi:glycosyltransferase involved in cell wall biosynthesis